MVSRKHADWQTICYERDFKNMGTLRQYIHPAIGSIFWNPSVGRWLWMTLGSVTRKNDTNNTGAALPWQIPRLEEKEIKRTQQIYESIMWYMRACDIKTTKALNAIGREQSRATETTKMWSNWFLNYLATHPEAKIRYWKSDMRLLIHSDTSFLVE